MLTYLSEPGHVAGPTTHGWEGLEPILLLFTL